MVTATKRKRKTKNRFSKTGDFICADCGCDTWGGLSQQLKVREEGKRPENKVFCLGCARKIKGGAKQ